MVSSAVAGRVKRLFGARQASLSVSHDDDATSPVDDRLVASSWLRDDVLARGRRNLGSKGGRIVSSASNTSNNTTLNYSTGNYNGSERSSHKPRQPIPGIVSLHESLLTVRKQTSGSERAEMLLSGGSDKHDPSQTKRTFEEDAGGSSPYSEKKAVSAGEDGTGKRLQRWLRAIGSLKGSNSQSTSNLLRKSGRSGRDEFRADRRHDHDKDPEMREYERMLRTYPELSPGMVQRIERAYEDTRRFRVMDEERWRGPTGADWPALLGTCSGRLESSSAVCLDRVATGSCMAAQNFADGDSRGVCSSELSGSLRRGHSREVLTLTRTTSRAQPYLNQDYQCLGGSQQKQKQKQQQQHLVQSTENAQDVHNVRHQHRLSLPASSSGVRRAFKSLRQGRESHNDLSVYKRASGSSDLNDSLRMPLSTRSVLLVNKRKEGLVNGGGDDGIDDAGINNWESKTASANDTELLREAWDSDDDDDAEAQFEETRFIDFLDTAMEAVSEDVDEEDGADEEQHADGALVGGYWELPRSRPVFVPSGSQGRCFAGLTSEGERCDSLRSNRSTSTAESIGAASTEDSPSATSARADAKSSRFCMSDHILGEGCEVAAVEKGCRDAGRQPNLKGLQQGCSLKSRRVLGMPVDDVQAREHVARLISRSLGLTDCVCRACFEKRLTSGTHLQHAEPFQLDA